MKREDWIGLVIAVAAALIMVTVKLAFAHGDADWIRQGGYRDNQGMICCSEHDCGVAQPGEIRRIDGAWLHVQTNSILKDGDPGIHRSKDAQTWRCVPGGRMNCLFLSAGI